MTVLVPPQFLFDRNPNQRHLIENSCSVIATFACELPVSKVHQLTYKKEKNTLVVNLIFQNLVNLVIYSRLNYSYENISLKIPSIVPA